MTDRRHVTIGSRESALAVVQSQMVMDYLKRTYPELDVSILTMKTTGDKILDRRLDQIGGKGLFVKELDLALREGRSDYSVHSLKDMPMEVPEDLPIVCFSKREDPRDVLILPEGASEPDPEKPIGTSSRRRILQLKKLYPNAKFESVRGNLQTRLRKLDEGQYGALILAAAGVRRMGLENRINRYFTTEEIIPAAGQGILAVQGRAGEAHEIFAKFADVQAAAAALAERAFVRRLDGGCTSPIAAYGQIENEKLILHGFYYDEETGESLTGNLDGSPEDAEKIGEELADRLKKMLNERAEKMADTGKVWLVGAGPGDVGLLTRKGYQVLQEADVVVYDSLIGDALLALIPAHTEKINVGKRASNHIMPQEKINVLLLQKAQEGKKVVRLKGGDPFLFGRGGEELELLAERRIPYEIVPGVTSSIAVPAYNGIPVTHRDFTSSLHIITGHKRAGQEYDIDFDALVRTRGTLVFLMGVSSLGDICRGLLTAGMDADMPAAILQKGTTAGQKRIVATVSTLEEEVKRRGIETPAIIVVGKVCSLADTFAWYEKLPLSGAKILVTRPKELISTMSERLRKAGAEVLELPAISTVPIAENHRLKEAIDHLDKYQWLVFTSPTGVRFFFDELLQSDTDLRKLANVKLAVIGEGTRKELRQRGLKADLMPEIYDGEHLGAALAVVCVADDRILIPRAKIGNPELVRALEKFSVDDIPTYDTLPCGQSEINLSGMIERGEITCAAFTSSSSVRAFVEANPGLSFCKVRAACIGRQTRETADKAGMQTWMSEKATMDSLLDLILEMHTGRIEV